MIYFITWTTYGTWLRGDERGWNIELGRGSGEEAPDPIIQNDDRARLKHPPTVLDASMRAAVDRTIQEVARHRGWTIGAISVRTNHVHVVVEAEATPERVMNDFKSWATRRLREAGLANADQLLWTKHGSTRYLKNSEGIRAAIDYVERFQDERAGRFGGERLKG